MLPSFSSPVRSKWSSQFAFILVSAGAAIGLGNIWKFPYILGSRGGGTFLVLHLVFITLIALPVLLAELLMGRRGHQNIVTSIQLLSSETNASPRWQGIGWLCSITLILILSFYSVVAGWALAYLTYSWHGDLTGLSPLAIENVWQGFLANPVAMLFWHSIFILMVMGVVAKGIHQGIEKASKILIPVLFMILIMLLGYATGTGHFLEGIQYLFDIQLEKITPQTIVAAMGHAFFTLSIGAGSLLVYSSYSSKSFSLGEVAVSVVLMDFLASTLTAVSIFPILFSHGLKPETGPGLTFEILPIAFSTMEGGAFLGGLFFLLSVCAAWTSAISLAEPLVALLSERYKVKRIKATLFIGFLAWLLGILSILSFNLWKSFKIFGKWTLFVSISDFSSNILLPIGGLLIAIFTGWILHRRITREELAFQNESTYKAWRFLIRWVSPLGILIILLYPVYLFIRGYF